VGQTYARAASAVAALAGRVLAVAARTSQWLGRTRRSWNELFEMENLSKTIREGIWTGLVAPETLLLEETKF